MAKEDGIEARDGQEARADLAGAARQRLAHTLATLLDQGAPLAAVRAALDRAAAQDARDAEEAARRRMVRAVADELYANTFETAGPALRARLAARRAGTERPLATPWRDVNAALGGGLWPGLHFVVGTTGGGKSQFALQIALHAAGAGVPVVYVALELAPLDLYARALGILDPRQKWSEIYLGRAPVPDAPVPGDPDRRSAVATLDALPFHWAVGTPRGWPHEQLALHAAALRTLYPRAPTMLLVIDFAQLLSGAERDLRERISAAAYAARAVARDAHAAVLMLSSVAREHYAALLGTAPRRNGKRADSAAPPAADSDAGPGKGNPARLVGLGKESGDTEYAADSVLVLTHEPWDGPTPPPGGTRVHLAIAKWRAGETGWVPLRWNGSRFTSAPPDAAGPPRETHEEPTTDPAPDRDIEA